MPDMTRRLVLLRHATAQRTAMSDEGRPLTEAGLAEAARLGAWLESEGLLGDVVLCSPALRTRQTWAAIEEETGHGVVIDMQPAIYEASVDDLLRVVRDVEATHPDAQQVVLVGHAPGVPALAVEVSSGAGDDATSALARGFVPASAAVVEFDGAWGDLTSGVARLVIVRPGDAR